MEYLIFKYLNNKGGGEGKRLSKFIRLIKETLRAINSNIKSGASVYSDDLMAYLGIVGYNYEAVKHSIGEYVRGKAHTNGIESFWVLLKRGYYGTFHHFSEKHIQRYIDEFAEWQNTMMMRPIERFGHFIRLTVGKRFTYSELI